MLSPHPLLGSMELFRSVFLLLLVRLISSVPLIDVIIVGSSWQRRGQEFVLFSQNVVGVGGEMSSHLNSSLLLQPESARGQSWEGSQPVLAAGGGRR